MVIKRSVSSKTTTKYGILRKQFNDNTQAGDIKYADISGPDGVPDNVVDEYDRTVIGNRFPNFEYSVSLGASLERIRPLFAWSGEYLE